MLLTEKNELMLSEAYSSFEHKLMDKEALKEWVESDSSVIPESKFSDFVKLAQLQEKYINETNFAADIAGFTPRLQGLLRRVAPKLMAFDICGVQPIAMPTTDVFMLKAQYAGTTAASADKDNSVILEMTQGTVAQAVAKGDTLTSAGGAVGTVIYVESDYSKAVVNVTSGTFVAGEKLDADSSYTLGDNDITIVNVYSNEAGFRQILPGYTGSYTTANGETLGAEMNQIRVNIVKQSVTAKSRKIKAELTIELIRDMKQIHGADAEKEIMFFLESEIVNDINLELIYKYKSVATALPNYALATDTTNVDVSKGRWSQEQYSALYDRMLKDGTDLSAKNRRGKATHLVATSGIITALQSLKLLISPSVQAANNHAENFVGTLPSGVKVYQDWFSTSEYYMPIYKGASSFDSGVIYSPYAPIELLTATNSVTLQPVLGMATRYALTANALFTDGVVGSTDGSAYASLRVVDFTGTPIA